MTTDSCKQKNSLNRCATDTYVFELEEVADEKKCHQIGATWCSPMTSDKCRQQRKAAQKKQHEHPSWFENQSKELCGMHALNHAYFHLTGREHKFDEEFLNGIAESLPNGQTLYDEGKGRYEQE